MHRRRIAPEHSRDVVAVPVWHLGGAVHFEHVTRRIISPDRPTRFHRDAGVTSDREAKLDYRMSCTKCGLDIAIALADHCRLGGAARVEFARGRIRREQHRQLLDVHFDEIRSVLGDIWAFGEHRGDRVAHISHTLFRQYGLAIRLKSLDACKTEIDRRHIGDVRVGPHCNNPRQRARRSRVDRPDAPVRESRAHDAHMKLMWKRNVRCKAAASRHQRPVLQTRDRAANEAGHSLRISAAAARTALMIFW